MSCQQSAVSGKSRRMHRGSDAAVPRGVIGERDSSASESASTPTVRISQHVFHRCEGGALEVQPGRTRRHGDGGIGDWE